METEDERISIRVRRMMEKHGVHRRAQASLLADILGMSYSAATRKMRGKLPWKVEQVREVAAHFNEPVEALVEESAYPRGTPKNGVFIVERRRFPCIAWIDESRGEDGGEAGYVAFQHRGQYLVYPAADAPAAQGLQVERLELDSPAPGRGSPVLAVVDDAMEMVESLCEYFAGRGLQATAFDSLREFERALEQTSFDCVVIDWLFDDGETAAGAIAKIRASARPDAPIFLLTGQFVTGRADEDAIAAAIQRFGLTYMEKPVRPFILFAAIARALGLS